MATAKELLGQMRSRGTVMSEHDLELLLDEAVARSGNSAALINRSTVQSVAADAIVAVVFDTVDYDDDNFFSLSTPSRLTVPAGVSRIRLWATIRWDVIAGEHHVVSLKNGDTFASETPGPGMFAQYTFQNNNLDTYITVSSADVAVIPGDFFELGVLQSSINDPTNLVEAQFAITVVGT